MSSKNIILLIDNRQGDETVIAAVPVIKNQLNGSGFQGNIPLTQQQK